MSKNHLRHREYARMQELFMCNMSRAAKDVLDGQNESVMPSLASMTEYWAPILRLEFIHIDGRARPQERPDLQHVLVAVTIKEIAGSSIDINSAPGIDMVTARQWRAVPTSIKALFFNIILVVGGFPQSMLTSRTVFLPKKMASVTPAGF